MGTTPAGERYLRNPIDPRNPLARVYLLLLLFIVAESGLRFLIAVHLDSLGFSLGEIGVVLAVFAVATLASRLPAGVAFRPGRARWLLIAAGAASAICYSAVAWVTSLPLVCLLLALDGWAWGTAMTVLLTVMMTTRPEQLRTSVAMGWYVGCTGLGHALAGVVAGAAGQLAGVRETFVLLGALPFVFAVLLALRLPAPRDDAPARQAGRPALAQLARLPPAVWVAAGTATYLNVMNSVLNTFFPLLGLSMGLSLAQAGSLNGIRSGVSAVARFGSPVVFRRISAARARWPLLLGSAVTTALVPATAVYGLQAPLWAANGAIRGLLRVGTGSTALDEVAEGEEGISAAVMEAGLDVGKIAGPLVGGVAADAFGLPTMFLAVPAAFLLLAALAGTTARRAFSSNTGS